MRAGGVVGADILAEKPTANAAYEIGGSLDGVLPQGRIDGGIVNDADQVAQMLLVAQTACQRNRA
jgi:hypothetical protein